MSEPMLRFWCHSNFNEFLVEFIWVIDDIQKLLQVTEYKRYESSTFSVKTDSGVCSNWRLQLSFYPAKGDRTAFFHVNIQLIDTTLKEGFFAKYCFYVLDEKGVKRYTPPGYSPSQYKKLAISGHQMTADCGSASVNDLLTGDKGLLSGGKLTLLCELTVLDDKFLNIQGQIDPVPHYGGSEELAGDFSKLLESPQFSDVILVAEGKEFHVHKNVLVARSPVFAAMFKHKMEESLNNKVKIEDIHPDVLWGILQYMYTGSTSKLPQMARELYVAAEKYGLEALKRMCIEPMRSGLSVSNSAETLVLADLHGNSYLKDHIIAFIRLNLSEVMETPKFNEMFTTHPKLIQDIMTSVAAKRARR